MNKSKFNIFGKLFEKKDNISIQETKKTCKVCGHANSIEVNYCSRCSFEFTIKHDNYDAFISYRRESGSNLASLIKVHFETSYNKAIFLDVKELQVGKFDEKNI